MSSVSLTVSKKHSRIPAPISNSQPTASFQILALNREKIHELMVEGQCAVDLIRGTVQTNHARILLKLSLLISIAVIGDLLGSVCLYW
jgi:hypothetical protein